MSEEMLSLTEEERHEALWRLVRDPNTPFRRLLEATEGTEAFSTARDDEPAFLEALFGHPSLTVEGLEALLRPPRRYGHRETPPPPAGWAAALLANPAIPLFFLEDPAWLQRLGAGPAVVLAKNPACARAWFGPLWDCFSRNSEPHQGWDMLVESVDLEIGKKLYDEYHDRMWKQITLGMFNPRKPIVSWWVRNGIEALLRGEDLTQHRHYAWFLAPKTTSP